MLTMGPHFRGDDAPFGKSAVEEQLRIRCGSSATIPSDMVPEEALQTVATIDGQSANIVNGNDQVVGGVSLDQIVKGLARPDLEAQAGQYRQAFRQ